MFKTHPILISRLLDEIDDGKMQLPEFQRGWIWDESRIRDLLTSVAQGFPIGAIMRLDAGGDLNFKPRPIDGTKPTQLNPDTFLLDGQQRMTSLYQALKYTGPVNTYNSSRRKVKRWYYVNMVEALREVPNYEKMIFSVPCKKQLTANIGRTVELDLSSSELEYNQHMMPTKYLLDAQSWLVPYLTYWTKRDYPHGSLGEVLSRFDKKIIKSFTNFPLPVIDLDENLPREAVCLVFEKVNTGGITLTTFELLTAILAAQGFDLREDWSTRWERMQEWLDRGVLRKTDKDQFIQAVALLVTSNRRAQAQREGKAHIPAVSCRRSEILSISRAEYEKWADEAEKGFKRAARFLTQQSIFSARDIPYITQFTSLAVILALVGDKSESARINQKLERWFWTGIFGEIYGGPTETIMANDAQRVPEFLRADVSLPMLEEATFEPARLLSLRTRNTAAYKGINALLMKDGAVDWRKNELISSASYYGDNIDIHHIFPKRWCEKEAQRLIGSKIPPRIFNSAINKTPLSAKTNQIIGRSAPSDYVQKLRPDALDIDSAIRGHHIAFEHLQNDDFVSFFVERGMALMRLISEAMGKDLPDGEGVFKGALETANLRSETDDYDDEED